MTLNPILQTVLFSSTETRLSSAFEAIMLFLLVAGMVVFVSGLKMLQTKRLMENIPTSKVATAAVGTNVEICGHLIGDELMIAPISGKPCVFFSLEFLTEDHLPYSRQRMDKDLILAPLRVQIRDKDGGVAQIDPRGADFVFKEEAEEYWHAYTPLLSKKPIPERLKEVLLENEDQIKPEKLEKLLAGDASLDYKFNECAIGPEDPVYVLGYATTADDGRTLLLKKGEQGDFMISNKSEEELTREWGYDIPFMIFGGPAMTTAAMIILYLYWW